MSIIVNNDCTVKYKFSVWLLQVLFFHKGWLLTWAQIFYANWNIQIIFVVLTEDIYLPYNLVLKNNI